MHVNCIRQYRDSTLYEGQAYEQLYRYCSAASKS